MRGEVDPQSSMFHYFSVESRIPADHPLRRVKKLAESALSAISAELDGLYARTGRPAIPPERLLKAQLLIAFYSVLEDVGLAQRNPPPKKQARARMQHSIRLTTHGSCRKSGSGMSDCAARTRPTTTIFYPLTAALIKKLDIHKNDYSS